MVKIEGKSVSIRVREIERRPIQIKNTITIILATAILACLGCKDKVEVAAEFSEVERAAITAALEWLKTVDSEEYEKSWAEVTKYDRNPIEKEKWIEIHEAGRKLLGQVIKREAKKTQYKTTHPGLPDGHYYIIEFSSRFTKKRKAVEILLTRLEEDGVWRVHGYIVK